MHTENLIVGLGIAGINLCHQLELAGRPFTVIDPCPVRSSSLIAGGIYNPIVIKRKVKTWKADELFAFLVPHYRDMEMMLGEAFLHHDFPILKPISSRQELDEWQAAIDNGTITPYVTEVKRERPMGPFQDAVCGHVTIRHSGFLRTEEAILAYRKYLRASGRLIEIGFEHSRLQSGNDGVRYEGLTADRVIFCEGRFISENPWFNWLPMRPTKGQMLTVSAKTPLTPDHVYNQQFYLFPTCGHGKFRLGATYEWGDMNEETTDIAKEELLSRTWKALRVDLEVLDQQAAIRPNVADRRPLIGRHPDLPSMFLFNGMGSKGVMLAPFFAYQLVGHIYEGKALDSEADLNRFIKRYRASKSEMRH